MANARSENGASRHSRRFALLGAAMIGLAAILWLGAASLVAYRIKYPPFLEHGHTDVYGPRAPMGEVPPALDPRVALGADFESLKIHAANNRNVDAWMIPGKLPAAIVLVPPAGGSRRTMLPYAAFLHQAGYPLLVLDSGDDAKSGTSWGWTERTAVLAAASELRRRGFKKVGALGISEGASEIIQVQSAGASFDAIVADSAYGNLAAMFQRVPSIAGLNPALEQTAVWEAGYLIGHSIWKIDTIKAARNMGEAAILVIHNNDDKVVPVAEAQAISAAAGKHADLWIVASGGHADAIYEAPDQYGSRVLKFFETNLLAPSSNGPRTSAGYIRGGIKSTSSVDFNRSKS